LTWTYVPIRHGPRPDGPEPASGPDVSYLAGTVAAIAAGYVAWRFTASAALAVFWAVVAGYVVATLARFAAGHLVRRAIVAVAAAGTAVGAMTISGWDRGWSTVAVALAAGTLVHGLLAWALVPALLSDDQPRTGRSPR
jgi:TRAP-type uncharacterized transport system fused permease subunit